MINPISIGNDKSYKFIECCKQQFYWITKPGSAAWSRCSDIGTNVNIMFSSCPPRIGHGSALDTTSSGSIRAPHSNTNINLNTSLRVGDILIENLSGL